MLDLEKQVKGKPSGEPYRISVRAAITASDNAAAEKLLKDVGPPNVVEWAKALGVTSNLAPTKSLALGAYEVTPLELANVYVTFANGGEVERPKLIRRIIAPGGAIRPLAEVPPKRRVMTPDEAYLTTSLMRSVVEKGTGQRARALGRPVVGKTGTTNDAKDTWFVGYSTDIVTAVWVGYDDALPLGAAESGAVTALPAWVTFMKAAHDKRPPTEFPRPPSIIVASVDPATGLLAYSGQEDAVDEEFLEGTVPTDTAQPDAGAPEAGVPHEGEAALSNGTAEIPGSLPPAPTPETVPVSGNEPPDSGVEPPPF
jgi:penicillin-binding protein 1A